MATPGRYVQDEEHGGHLEGAQQPAAEVKGHREEKSVPPMTVEFAQAAVEALGIRAVLDESSPGKQPPRLAHQARELGHEEATDQERFEPEQRPDTSKLAGVRSSGGSVLPQTTRSKPWLLPWLNA